jgi:hypothetical protein
MDMMGPEGMGDMMQMMSKMMERCKQMGAQMMPEMMMEMMPKCLGMMLPSMPKEKRITFTLNMVAILKEQGCVGMSEEGKKDFLAKIIEKVQG